MGLDFILAEVERVVKRIIPSSVKITQIELEGPVVVVYTADLDAFADDNDIVRKLAQGLRRRVAIRPDPSFLADLDRAETEIRHIVPEEAEITDIYFQPDVGEVTIEAISPGLAIGKHGSILNTIKKRIGWAPKVVRTPPIPSKTVREIRAYLRGVADERKAFLKRLGRRLARDVSDDKNYVRVTFLGGFREVGRSCSLLSTRNSKILIDCGVMFGGNNGSSPYLNAAEALPLENIDGVVVTHAHLDHCGLVPLLFKYGYDGPVYCTPPTRDLSSLLQLDYLKVAAAEGRRAPYESGHVRDTVRNTITLRYGDTTDIAPDMRLTLQNAGHILGSAISHFHIGDGLHNIAFTGDIKFEKTWLFNPAVNHFPRLESLVVESTYGARKDFQPSRRQSAKQLKQLMNRTLRREGKMLIPVFAIGRSQEVMIVLEKLMRNNEIPTVPIYLDGMIMEATAIHTAYPEYLNNKLRNMIFQRGENPFLSDIFTHVDSQQKREEVCEDPESCIVLATSGMMTGGPVMEYLKCYAPEKKNTLVFVGYQGKGTLGRRIQRGRRQVQLTERGTPIKVEIKMDVTTCDGFSGHSDRRQLVSFISTMDPKPERVIVNHGEESKVVDLASSIYRKYNIETRAPYNLETIRLC